jgi:retinol dehydrogenase 12
VVVSSAAHYQPSGIDFAAVRRPTQSRTGYMEYGVSKLANVLHAQELARRLAGSGVTTYSLHPGVIASDVWRRVPWPIRSLIKLRMSSVEQGARTSLYCATDPELGDQSGLYYQDCRPRAAAATATVQLGRELWARSEDWVGPRA